MYSTLIAGSWLLYVAVWGVYLGTRQARLAHPASIYLAFHGLVFVLRPTLAFWLEYDFIYRLYEFQPSASDKSTALLAANLAMLTFVGTALWLGRNGSGTLAPAMPLDQFRAALQRPLLITSVLIVPAAVWSQIANWGQRASRFADMVRDPATGALINTNQVGWFTDLGLMLAALAVLVVWTARFRWWSWAVFAGFAVLQAGTGTRGPLIYAALALLIAFLLETGRKWPRWRSLAAVALLGIVFGQLLDDRGQTVRQRFAGDSTTLNITERPGKPLEGMDFASLEYLEYVIHAVPQRTGTYDYFATNLQLLTEPIPRALWRDKPVGSPVQFFSLWDYGRPVGMTLSVPGAGWMALGWVGVIVQAWLWALIYGGSYRALLRRHASGVAILAYALLAATGVVALRDGVFISLVRVLPFYLGPLVLCLLIMRVTSSHASRPRQASSVEPNSETPTARRQRLASEVSTATPRWQQSGSSRWHPVSGSAKD